jgi:hypothetical protein
VEHIGHPVIQKAAKAKNPFHINEFDNGIAVEAWQNTNHPQYNNRVEAILENYKNSFDNFDRDVSAEEAYEFLNLEMSKLYNLIDNNPTVKINDLIFR